MLKPKAIREAEAEINRLHRRIHETFAHRTAGEAAWRAWEKACEEYHASISAIDFLWTGEFYQRLRGGDRDALEDAILFLEVDPWYHRSGYLKEILIRSLKKLPLRPRECRRLQNAVWNVARGPNRREFRYFCALAAKVVSRDFITLLEQVPKANDLEAKGKFSYLLRYLRRHERTAAWFQPSHPADPPSAAARCDGSGAAPR